MSEPKKQIEQLINGNKVVLFMKGTPDMPRCGFSAVAVQCLQNLGAEFVGVDVLADQNIREEIKAYSNWPTIPQLYINQQFIGGSDIIREMYSSGELKQTLDA